MGMDDKDVQICKILASNSRVSYREIGAALDLSVNSVHKRIQALLHSGVINRFILAPSLKLLDAIVVIVFGPSSTANMKQTIEDLGANPNTYKIVLATGNFLYVHGILRKVSDMEKYISFVRSVGSMHGAETGIVSSPERLDTPLSKLDYLIVQALNADARRDLSEVSKEIGVSTKTVKRRLERMIAAGIIIPSIEFNPAMSGSVMCMLHLLLANHQRNLLGIGGVENHPDLLFFNAWASNMKELKDLQESIEGSGLFRASTPHVFYSNHIFDSWKDKAISDRASDREG